MGTGASIELSPESGLFRIDKSLHHRLKRRIDHLGEILLYLIDVREFGEGPTTVGGEVMTPYTW